MRQVPYSIYLLPPGPGRSKPRASGWKMSPQDAEARGALGIVAGTTELRQVPETEEELRRAQVHHQAAGRDSVKPPR